MPDMSAAATTRSYTPCLLWFTDNTPSSVGCEQALRLEIDSEELRCQENVNMGHSCLSGSMNPNVKSETTQTG